MENITFSSHYVFYGPPRSQLAVKSGKIEMLLSYSATSSANVLPTVCLRYHLRSWARYGQKTGKSVKYIFRIGTTVFERLCQNHIQNEYRYWVCRLSTFFIIVFRLSSEHISELSQIPLISTLNLFVIIFAKIAHFFFFFFYQKSVTIARYLIVFDCLQLMYQI